MLKPMTIEETLVRDTAARLAGNQSSLDAPTDGEFIILFENLGFDFTHFGTFCTAYVETLDDLRASVYRPWEPRHAD